MDGSFKKNEVIALQQNFREKLLKLKKHKRTLLSNLRRKLELLKIEEVKKEIE